MKQIVKLRAFCDTVTDFKLFDYQIDFLKDCLENKRVVGIFARQTGKTTLLALFALYEAIRRDNYHILIIAPTDRQTGEMFGRLRNYAEGSGLVAPFIDYSSLRELRLTNGSLIRAVPTGDFGHTIRGQTANLVILEESSYIKDEIVYQVIMPMIAATDGDVIQIGTPFYRNHFYEASMDQAYKVHQYDWTYCPLIKKDFVDEQEKNLTKIQFTMEYLADFIEESDAFFTVELLNSCVSDYPLVDRSKAYAA